MKKVDLNMLNPEQKKAVLHKDGPMLVLAGAGSGKTATMINRIGYMVETYKVPPSNILAVTFTNKAAQEMKERAEAMVGGGAKDITISTFHSFCAKFLRKTIHNLEPYNSNYSILDMDDAKKIIKEIVKGIECSDPKALATSTQSYISSLKCELVSPTVMESVYSWLKNPLKKVPELPPYINIDKAISAIRKIPEIHVLTVLDIYKKYQQYLKSNICLDFDDLLCVTIEILANNMDVLNKAQEHYKYIMIDEYQDTNHAQYILTRLLSAKYRNLFVVGDDNQSIYKFRSADMRNILNFQKDYPESKIIKLERNYRSTQTILDAANKVISNNKNQFDKKLWTDKGNGEPIVYQICEHNDAEGKYIADCISIMSLSRPLSDFAILYRTNAQSRAIEDHLRRRDLLYNIVGGFSFYDRKVIKDIVAYLKFIVNPNDGISLSRIINVPTRGIGDTTLQKVSLYAKQEDISLWESLQLAKNYLKGNTLKKIEEFVSMIKKLMSESETLMIGEFLMAVTEDTGYRESLEKEDTDESRDQLENIQEFLNIAWEYQYEEDASLLGFVERISLVREEENAEKKEKDKVTLMTIHASKGLEFPVVFLVGMEEDILPYWRAKEEDDGIEEERRLCYVAITRARERLLITRCIERRQFNNINFNDPSRFLIEIGLEEEKRRSVLPW